MFNKISFYSISSAFINLMIFTNNSRNPREWRESKFILERVERFVLTATGKYFSVRRCWLWVEIFKNVFWTKISFTFAISRVGGYCALYASSHGDVIYWQEISGFYIPFMRFCKIFLIKFFAMTSMKGWLVLESVDL